MKKLRRGSKKEKSEIERAHELNSAVHQIKFAAVFHECWNDWVSPQFVNGFGDFGRKDEMR